MKMLNTRIKNKKDTKLNWELNNPLILDGEIILVDDSGEIKIKIGNGIDTYNNLPFYGTIYADKPQYSYQEIVGLTDVLSNIIPRGMIMIWSGTNLDIPNGWNLCDGTNGTPDLSDKFVIAAGATYTVGLTGGEATTILTVAQLPSHNHTYNLHQIDRNDGLPETGEQGYGANNKTLPIVTANTGLSGNNEPHNNMPPYYSLCYIMKL